VPEYRNHLAFIHGSLGDLLAGMRKPLEAEEQYRKSLTIKEKLADQFPAVPEYQVELGGSYCNFGGLLMSNGRPDESLGWFEKAIRTLTAVYEHNRRSVPAGQFLRNSYWNRAQIYYHLRKFTEAIADWDRAIELSPLAEQPRLRAGRGRSRIHVGQFAEAVAEVAELSMNPSWPALEWYNFACIYSFASGKSTEKKQEYADRAMDLLRKAVKEGWNAAAHMANDPDLDPIRGRDDFNKLIEGLAKKPG
jgi:tetratricopeptide (TPR) repeat protein